MNGKKSDKSPDKNGKPAIENQSDAAADKLFAGLRLVALLILVAAVSWVAFEFGVADKLVSHAPTFTKEDGSKSDDVAADTELLQPDAVIGSIVDVLNVPANEVEADNSPQEAKGESLDSLEPMPLAEESEKPTTIPTLASEPIAEDAAAHNKNKQISQSEQLQQQEHLIRILRCQLSIRSNRRDSGALQSALKQCYAVAMSAGVSVQEYKILTEMGGKEGVPDKARMNTLFKSAAIQALRVTHKEVGVERNWLDDGLEHMNSLFTVRKKGWQEGDGVEAIIGRAEHYLQHGEYGKLKRELEFLPDRATKFFKEFDDALTQYQSFYSVLRQLTVAAERMEAGGDS